MRPVTLTSVVAPRSDEGPALALLTPKQVAEALQVSRGLVSVLTKRGELPAVYVGRLPRYRREDLERYIAARLGGTP